MPAFWPLMEALYRYKERFSSRKDAKKIVPSLSIVSSLSWLKKNRKEKATEDTEHTEGTRVGTDREKNQVEQNAAMSFCKFPR